MKNWLLSILWISALRLSAQSDAVSAPSTDKFYVVVGVIAIIFILIVIYLFRLDKKISKIEKEL